MFEKLSTSKKRKKLACRNRVKRLRRDLNWFFTWEEKSWLLDGWLPKVSFSISIAGYILIFADGAGIDLATTSVPTSFFGLLLLGSINIIYRAVRPSVLRRADDAVGYSIFAINHYTFQDFVQAHKAVKMKLSPRYYGADIDGNYKKQSFFEFINDSAHHYYHEELKRQFQDLVLDNINLEFDFQRAKSKHESLLYSITRAYFRTVCNERPYFIFTLLALAFVGYLLISYPTLNMLFRYFSA